MNIKLVLLKIVTLFSSLYIVFCIKSVELCINNSEQTCKQSNWKVGEQIPFQTEQLQQFGISMWFRTRQNQIDKETISLLDISTNQNKIFGMDFSFEDSELLLLPYAREEQPNLKLHCGNDEWRLLVVSFQEEVFVQVFSAMNDKYSDEKIRYKPSISFLIVNLNVFITYSPQIIEYNNLFLYFSVQNQNLYFMQSYIINTAIQRNDCQKIQRNRKLRNDYIRHQCCDSLEKFNSYNQIIKTQYKTIHIISFNLVEYKHSQNDGNILFKFNNQFNLLISENNNKQFLIFQFNNQHHNLGEIDNQQSQITLQIEFNQFQEYSYFIQYYQNQNLQRETRINKMIPFKYNKQQDLMIGEQFEDSQIVNMMILTNFKISKTKNKDQQINNCLLKAISITESTKDSHICIFYQVKNDNQNILQHNIQRKHKKRKLQANSFIHGSNMRSIVRNSYSASQYKSTINSAQSINTVLIVGYFKLSQSISGTQYLPLITVGVLSDYYNIFNVYMKSNTLIELKYIKDTDNLIFVTTFNNASDMTNKWYGIGLLFSKITSQLKLVITNQSTNIFSGSSEINSVIILSSTQTLDVCITCTIQGGIFGHFDGSVSSVKIIYDVSYTSISSYLFFNEYSGISKSSILSASFDMNTYSSNSEYDLGQGFTCNLDYAFYEGVCIDKNNCKTLIQDSSIYSSFEMGKFYDSVSKKCLNCPSNCLECSSASVCTTCRSSYKIFNNLCIRCDNINKCVSSCPSQQIDPMNQICVDTFNTSLQSLSNLLLSSRIINDNSDIVVQNSPSFSSINDQIVHCYIDVDNNPMTLISFLGGVQFITTTIIKKSFSQIPKGYQKSVSFYVLFYGSGSPSNLQVKINTNLAALDSQSTIVSNKISCSGSGTQTQSIFQVKFVIQDNQNTFDLEIQSTSSQWGIRNLDVEISKCHPTCGSCYVGGKQLSEKIEEQNVNNNDNSDGKIIPKNDQNTHLNKINTLAQFQTGFNTLPIYKQVFIFHNFLGIFLLFNPSVPRTLRFLMFYVRSIHSLGIAVVFDQSYSFTQKIALAVFNSFSIIIILKIFEIGFAIKNIVGKIVIRVIAISVILGYYYIILSIVSGQEPGDSNPFFTTFILFYVSDLFIISLCSALIQRLIANKILKTGELEGIKKKLYELIQLKLILISIR